MRDGRSVSLTRVMIELRRLGAGSQVHANVAEWPRAPSGSSPSASGEPVGGTPQGEVLGAPVVEHPRRRAGGTVVVQRLGRLVRRTSLAPR